MRCEKASGEAQATATQGHEQTTALTEYQLRPAVITSSSDRELREYFTEVSATSGISTFDIIVPRDVT